MTMSLCVCKPVNPSPNEALRKRSYSMPSPWGEGSKSYRTRSFSWVRAQLGFSVVCVFLKYTRHQPLLLWRGVR